MAANPSVSNPASTDADRVCVHCGKVVNPDREPEPPEPGAKRVGAGGRGPGRISLVERVMREAVGLAVLVVVGLVFVLLALSASYPAAPGQTFAVPEWLLVGWPLLLVGAGVLGYREGRARGAFVAGLVAAVVAIASILIPPMITGHEAIQAAPGEGIVEVWLAVGLMIVGGGFFGLLGGGITALIGSRPRRVGRP